MESFGVPASPEKKHEEAIEKQENPNKIGSLLSLSKDILTHSSMVYRSVAGDAAIKDLFESGVVRNRQSAGVVEKNRWGSAVYWSRGAEGKYHNVQEGGYVIEAPYLVASEREVRREDVVAIYKKTEGKIENILEEK